MPLRMKPWLCIVLLGIARPIFAQLGLPGADLEARCEKYLKTPLPSDSEKVTSPTKWPDCDSYKSYSGIGKAVDFHAARRCAWSERLAAKANLEPRYTVASIFGGSAMLAALYANGEGVERNIPFALHFACESGWAPAEFMERVDHLESLQDKPASSQHFGFCDDITSGAMEGYCAAYDRDIADQKRSKALNEISALMTQDQRVAFSALIKAEEAYAMAHGGGETDTTGTARAMYAIDAEQSLREDFLAAIQSFEAGKYPSSSAAEYANADQLLNAAYRKSMADAKTNKDYYGTVPPKGIQTAERAWLKYRDAWVAFAKLRYPSVPAEAWLTLLARDRTSVLDRSFCGMDAIDEPCDEGDTWKPSPLP